MSAETWPDTAIVKSTGNAFDWRRQASAMPKVSHQGQRPAGKPTTGLAANNGTLYGLSRKSEKVLRDNRGNGFCTEIAPPFAAGNKTQRILPGGKGMAR